MDTVSESMRPEDARLPADIDAQPMVRAAAALKPTLRQYHEEIEREQRMPPALVEQLREAGFYKMVIPRTLGGLQLDTLTYLRVVELLAEGCGSVGWNLGNGGVGQLVTLGLPDDGVHEIYGKRADTIIAGTAVQGGGQGVPVEGGYRLTGDSPWAACGWLALSVVLSVLAAHFLYLFVEAPTARLASRLKPRAIQSDPIASADPDSGRAYKPSPAGA